MLALPSIIAIGFSGPTESRGACLNGPCRPGNEFCADPFKNAPQYHLMDQHGCGENDPNGPVFDPVHGVIHHFYQIHLAAAPGHGPDYGHFVSKDFVHWAPMPVAIWNGLDSSVTPPRVTKYDNQAIFTGSAVVVDGAGPGGKGPGVVNIYPGLCDKDDWPSCETGTLLAQAVPANYAADELLTNWTKPSYNPIVENTQRDPSTPWKNPATGEWRLRTFDSSVYGSASDADLLAGKWYEIGKADYFRTCECPSVYPLPAATPGSEAAYEAATKAGELPTTVHKTSCGGDWWQVGSLSAAAPMALGGFNATPGWEDLFEQRKIDPGNFYASKDAEYPTLDGKKRRINWGWATVPPQSTQTLPREVTFNAAARALQQYPIDELKALRGAAAYDEANVKVSGTVDLKVGAGVAKQGELLVSFALPKAAATFGIIIGTVADATKSIKCVVKYAPPSTAAVAAGKGYGVDVGCAAANAKEGEGAFQTLVLMPSETDLELRVFSDWTMIEAFFQRGRVAVTVASAGGNTPMDDTTGLALTAEPPGVPVTATAATVYPLKPIWTTPDAVRKQKRVYG